MAILLRSDQAIVHVNVEGVALDSTPWDMFEGGDLVAQSLAVFVGGIKEQIELGGLAKRNEVKVARRWSDVVAVFKKQCDQVCGDGVMEVTVQPLSAGYVPFGEMETYSGILLGVERAKFKAGPSEEEYMTLTMGAHGGVK